MRTLEIIISDIQPVNLGISREVLNFLIEKNLSTAEIINTLEGCKSLLLDCKLNKRM